MTALDDFDYEPDEISLEIGGRAKAAHVWNRDKLDWYVEPEVSTEQLLAAERFSGRVWDPCCGGGNIVRACRAAGLSAHGTDVTRRVPEGTKWFLGERDFLSSPPLPVFDSIIMNSPFFRAVGTEAFIRRALEITEGRSFGKIAAFTDIKFLAGSGRANGLWLDRPPTRVWIITPRPSCPPGEYLLAGNKAGGGTADWIWAVWDLAAVPDAGTSLGWLRRPS